MAMAKKLTSFPGVYNHYFARNENSSCSAAQWQRRQQRKQFEFRIAAITRIGSVLTVTIATNFAGNAGADPWAAVNGIGYGDVFLGQTWNPFGTDAHHVNDNAADGTHWSYGLSLDNRWSNTGGTFKLYQLNGASNADNIRNSESFLTCQIGTQCYYRNGQTTAVKTASSTVSDTGLTGTWTVTANQELKFTINAVSYTHL